MVVDDSVVIRRLVTKSLEQDPALEVVGSASNGILGLQRIPQLNPDVITLDIEMPGMDGLEMLRNIRQAYPNVRVIMFSTLTERGAAITLEALSLGADDYVTKASNEGSLGESMARLDRELIPKIKQFFNLPADRERRVQSVASGNGNGSAPRKIVRGPAKFPQVVAIGSSTGGPAALSAILPKLPADFPLPILIVQHMPPFFTRLLAERLAGSCALKVQEAAHGTAVRPGNILIAPGDFHMRAVADHGHVTVVMDQAPQENFCRPAVDVLFRSVNEAYSGAVLGVILTGMGQDGMRGCEVLRASGATILAQDEATSVVWGMPGAVAHAGLADRILPLNDFATEIVRVAERSCV